jgi:hypothetical protein
MADILCHAVEEHILERIIRSLKWLSKLDQNGAASLDALEALHATDSRNAGSLGAPWRDIAGGNVVNPEVCRRCTRNFTKEVVMRFGQELSQLRISFLIVLVTVTFLSLAYNFVAVSESKTAIF